MKNLKMNLFDNIKDLAAKAIDDFTDAMIEVAKQKGSEIGDQLDGELKKFRETDKNESSRIH
jgi:hypothetical protein